MTTGLPHTNLWTAAIPTIAQILHFANDLCHAIPRSSTSEYVTSDNAGAISETQKKQVQDVIQQLNGPGCNISWQQLKLPRHQEDSSTFALFPTLPTELRLKIWRHACDNLHFPGALGSGRVPIAAYGEPLGIKLACKESKTVLDEKMTKCSICFGTWITIKDSPSPSLWRKRKLFVKGSKIPCISCDVQDGGGASGGSGGFSMRIRYLMQYGNIWSEGQYHSTFLLMGKRLAGSEAMSFILPHFVEDLTGKGCLRKVSILQEDPGEREVYSSVLAPNGEFAQLVVF